MTAIITLVAALLPRLLRRDINANADIRGPGPVTALRSSVILRRNLVPPTAPTSLAAMWAVGIVEAISLHKSTTIVKIRSLIHLSVMLPLSRIHKYYCLGGKWQEGIVILLSMQQYPNNILNFGITPLF